MEFIVIPKERQVYILDYVMQGEYISTRIIPEAITQVLPLEKSLQIFINNIQIVLTYCKNLSFNVTISWKKLEKMDLPFYDKYLPVNNHITFGKRKCYA